MTVPFVNAEKLVSAFLRADEEMTALIGDRFYTTLPANPVFPCGRVTRVGGTPWSGPITVDEPWLQIDFWGGPKAVAWEAAVTCQGALKNRLPGQHADGLVYGNMGVRLGPLRYLPDSTYDPAKPRYTFDVHLLTRL